MNVPTRRMQPHPDLDQLKRQAKELLKSFLAGQPEAVTEVRAHFRQPDPAAFALHDAQLVLARAYGFPSWPKLKAYVDGVTVRRLADAVRTGDLPLATAMLDARPELVNLTMSYGDEHRPLHFAVIARSSPMVRLLMRRGASAREGIHPHRDATSAWTLARDRGYHELVAIIEEEEQRESPVSDDPPPAAVAESPDDPARAAVVRGDLDWLRAQHSAGTLVNPVRWEDGGLLNLAVRRDQPAILRFLLDAGFDPDERVSAGEGDWIAHSQGFALWSCAALGRREMAELLLAHGASPNVHVDSSGSAVYSAYSHKQWEMVELLQRHGGAVSADIASTYRQTALVREMFALDDRGQLPAGVRSSDLPLSEEVLRFAAGGGAVEIVRLALARIDLPRDDPRWFRWLAEPLSFWHHIPWLYAGNREFDRGSYLECFRLILQHCDPDVAGGFARTALHEVAAMGDHITDDEPAPFARALLERGARTDLRDDILQSTPLGWACRWGRATVVRALLEHGADPVEPHAEPWARPRAWAATMGHDNVLQVLAEFGG